jgi:hypothetical protein
LSVKQSIFGHFGHIHISNFDCPILANEDIGTFQISMINVQVVKGLQALQHLDQDVPDFFLVHVNSFLLVVTYFVEQVSVVGVLHYNADGQNWAYHKLRDLLSQKASL